MYYYMFWIKSSRGTDQKRCFRYRKKPTKDQIKDDLEEWCSKFGAWGASDNYVTYGYEPVKRPHRNVLLKKYKAACKRKEKANEQWSRLSQLLNPITGLSEQKQRAY